MKRWRPRARGRATRIRKRTCHVTVIVSRLPDEQLARIEARQAGEASRRARRVAGGRQSRRARKEEEQGRTGQATDRATQDDEEVPKPIDEVTGEDVDANSERGEPASPQERSDGGEDE